MHAAFPRNCYIPLGAFVPWSKSYKLFFLSYGVSCFQQVAFSSLNLLLHTEALMSAVGFLAAVSPSGSGNSRDTPTKDEKQEDDTRLKKGTVVFVKMMVLKGCVACWWNNQIQRNLISFVVWGEDQSLCDWLTRLEDWFQKKPINETIIMIINGVFRWAFYSCVSLPFHK